MEQQNIAATETSSVTWENMDIWVRAQVQGFIQQVLEEEVTAFLGRQKSQRRGGGWLSQWAWEPAAGDVELWDDHGPAAAHPRE